MRVLNKLYIKLCKTQLNPFDFKTIKKYVPYKLNHYLNQKLFKNLFHKKLIIIIY